VTTSIRRRAKSDSGSRDIETGPFATLVSNVVDNLALDESHLFVLRANSPANAAGPTPAFIDRFALDGAQGSTRMLDIAEIFNTPSWLPVGGGELAFTSCDETDCAVLRTSPSGAPKTLGRLARGTNLLASDAAGVYATSGRSIELVAHDGSSTRTIWTAPDMTNPPSSSRVTS
jgi:hypothetical protein